MEGGSGCRHEAQGALAQPQDAGHCSSLTAQWTSPDWATQLQWTLTKIVTPQSLSCLSVRISQPPETNPSTAGPRLTALPQPKSDVPDDSLPVSWSFQRIITRLVTRSRQHNITSTSRRLLLAEDDASMAFVADMSHQAPSPCRTADRIEVPQ